MPTRLDRIIEIQRLVVTRGDFGDEVEDWVELDTVWAHVNQTGADEAFEDSADREEVTRDARMEIRYRHDIDETMRVIYDELAWDIRGIAEFGYRDRLELLCQAEIGNQRFPFTGFTVMGGLSVDAVPEASEITIAQTAHNLIFPAFVEHARADMAEGERARPAVDCPALRPDACEPDRRLVEVRGRAGRPNRRYGERCGRARVGVGPTADARG